MPINMEREYRSSYWRLVDGLRSSLPFPFTVTELMALHMSRDILRVFDVTAFQECIQSLFDKMKTSLPSGQYRPLEKMSQSMHIISYTVRANRLMNILLCPAIITKGLPKPW
ncbi:MAG: hypothetical protein V1792_08885 [Pseudomonadota bacterium]